MRSTTLMAPFLVLFALVSSGQPQLETNQAQVSALCFGDGTGAACPCGNMGGLGEGCANSTGLGSSLLWSGSSSVSTGDFVLSATNVPGINLSPGIGLFFQGVNAINGGNGTPFYEGLRCVGGSVIRLEVVVGEGVVNSSVNISDAGLVEAGDRRYYQFWYRDLFAPGCTFIQGANLSSAVRVDWEL